MDSRTCARCSTPSGAPGRDARAASAPATRPADGPCCATPGAPPDGHAEAFARQLLLRWGVVFRDAAHKETLAPPWRDLLVSLRRMEARGEIRGGRFVDAYLGEQFALPEALDLLRAIRRTGETAALPTAPAHGPRWQPEPRNLSLRWPLYVVDHQHFHGSLPCLQAQTELVDRGEDRRSAIHPGVSSPTIHSIDRGALS